MLSMRRSAAEEVEQHAATIDKVEMQATFEEEEVAEGCLTVVKELHRWQDQDTSPLLRRRS